MNSFSNNQLKMGWIFLWQAVCIVASLFIVFITWNWSLINFLASINLTIPYFLIGSFKVIVYVFCGGILGSSLYVSYRAYSHIVYPNNHIGEGDLLDTRNELKIAEKDKAQEARRFSESARLWWYLRPLLGGVVGIIVFALIRLITLPLAGNPCGCGYYYGISTNLYYFGIAFIAGFCFGDFVKFIQRNSRKMFDENKKETK